MAEISSKQSVTGSCHCKAIQYEINKAPAELNTITKCNCTVCQKPGFAILSLDSFGKDFHLITPADESELKYYQFRSKDVYRFFCDKCGVQVWMRGKYEANGTEVHFFSVNANTIDQPQDGIDVSKFKVQYIERLTHTGMPVVQDKPYPGGMV